MLYSFIYCIHIQMLDNFIKFFIILFFILKISELKTNSNKKKMLIKNVETELKETKEALNIYKELLQLYIENREKFYIKGREFIMKQNGKVYNDSNIITFQDKLNYLLIHESPEEKADIVDKIQLRNYSLKILGKDICVPILKIYNDANEINFDELPEKFVLKCNHGSEMNIICKNKYKLNLEEVKHTLNNWMNINYGLVGFEYQYIIKDLYY